LKLFFANVISGLLNILEFFILVKYSENRAGVMAQVVEQSD
jgi:hypothetical protein